MIQKAKKEFFAIFQSLVCQIDLILCIVTVLNVFQHQATLPGHEGSFKDHKNAFLNDPKSQKRGFGHFLEVVLLDRLDIAYCESTKCFPTLGNVWKVPLIMLNQQNLYKKELEMRFLTNFIKFDWFNMSDMSKSLKVKKSRCQEV